MPYIELSDEPVGSPLIFLFTEGTIIKHRSILKILDFKSYLPIGDCVFKIREWHKQGADIVYCTSLRGKKAVITRDNMIKHGFAGSRLYFRSNHQEYKELVEEVRPDILIEDDCKSIGGEKEWCISKVKPELKKKITSIIVPEFEGIGHLPTDIIKLFSMNTKMDIKNR